MSTWQADDGSLIYYEVMTGAGERPALLLLPGLLGSINMQWRSLTGALNDAFDLILIDFRGHGRSENRERTLAPGRLVDDIVGVLDELKIEQVHVAGYDMGGYLGLMLALREPHRVATLLMHATKFYWNAAAVRAMRKHLDPETVEKTAPAYADQLVREHGGRWRQLARQAGDLVATIAEEGLTEGMARRVQSPVLVSVGDRDELVRLAEAARLSRVFPDGQLLVLPGVRHSFGALSPVPLVPTMEQFHRDR